jgi:hypothetical protein
MQKKGKCDHLVKSFKRREKHTAAIRIIIVIDNGKAVPVSRITDAGSTRNLTITKGMGSSSPIFERQDSRKCLTWPLGIVYRERVA